MGTAEPTEIGAIVARLREMAADDLRRRRDDRRERRAKWPSRDADAEAEAGRKQLAELEQVFQFLPQVGLRTLRMLEVDISRPDSLADGGAVNYGIPSGPGVAQFLVTHCSPEPPGAGGAPLAATTVQTHLVDLLTFRDILEAHGSSMFGTCLERVKKVL